MPVVFLLADVFHAVIHQRLLRAGIKIIADRLYDKAERKKPKAFTKQHNQTGNHNADSAYDHTALSAQQICRRSGRNLAQNTGGVIDPLQNADLRQAHPAVNQIEHPNRALHIQIDDKCIDIIQFNISF